MYVVLYFFALLILKYMLFIKNVTIAIMYVHSGYSYVMHVHKNYNENIQI